MTNLLGHTLATALFINLIGAACGEPVVDEAPALPIPSLSLDADTIIRVRRGQGLGVDVAIARDGGLVGDVNVTIEGVPPRVPAPGIRIDAEETVSKVFLSVPMEAAEGGPFPVIIRATSTDDPSITTTQPASLYITGRPGDIDTSFGAGGHQDLVDSAGSYSLWASEAAIDSMDRIVLVGNAVDSSDAPSTAWVRRLDHDGAIDLSFGDASIVRVSGATSSLCSGILPAEDGVSVVVHCATRRASEPEVHFLRKLNADGQTDATFGTSGEVLVSGSGAAPTLQAYGGAIAANLGRSIEVFGQAGTQLDGFSLPDPIDLNFQSFGVDTNRRLLLGLFSRDAAPLQIVRRLTTGREDTTFGSGGRLDLPTPAAHRYALVTDIAALPNGGFVATTFAEFSNGPREYALVQTTGAGQVDLAFGTSGRLVLGSAGAHVSLVVQEDSKILAPVCVLVDREWSCSLKRFLANGVLDQTFGVGGVVPLEGFPGVVLHDTRGGRVLVTNAMPMAQLRITRYWL